MRGQRRRYFTAGAPPAAEQFVALSTGGQLGDGHDPLLMYQSTDGGTVWAPTLNGTGKLPVIRCIQGIVQATFSDAQAAANTQHLIDQLDDYNAAGYICVSVGLQGGNAGTGTAGADSAKLSGDQSGGSINSLDGKWSAFNSDGTLKQAWKDRIEMVLAAANARGSFVMLNVFYQRQTDILATVSAVDAAMANLAAWLQTLPYRNYAVDLANEANANPSSHWDANPTTEAAYFGGDAEARDLILEWNSNWTGQPWRPAVGVSGRFGAGGIGPLSAAAGDITLPHLNGSAASSADDVLEDLVADYGKPAICNEAERTEVPGPIQSALTEENLAVTLAWAVVGGSIGIMVPGPMQRWKDSFDPLPFQYEAFDGTPVVPSSVAGSAAQYWLDYKHYLRAHFDHCASVVNA